MKTLVLAVISMLLVSCQKAPSIDKVDMNERYSFAINKLGTAKTEIERFYALNSAAKEAFNVGKVEDARKYAEEQSGLKEKYKKDWNYGNAVHDVNVVLGRIALQEGDTSKAGEYLLKAGDTPGSPQLDSFGPNMTLARDLLQKGEKEPVLLYFKKCSRFWKGESNVKKLTEWTKTAEAGQIPDFSGNLFY